jgi:hypothetical protein
MPASRTPAHSRARPACPGCNAHAPGFGSHASGYGLHASGFTSHTSGFDSHVSGFNLHTSGFNSHASGFNSHASGFGSHTSGSNSHASGSNSHASGFNSHASGFNSHASGFNSHAPGSTSHQLARSWHRLPCGCGDDLAPPRLDRTGCRPVSHPCRSAAGRLPAHVATDRELGEAACYATPTRCEERPRTGKRANITTVFAYSFCAACPAATRRTFLPSLPYRMPTDLPPDYAELHCCSNFSFLRGASHPEELVEAAQALGYSALAITDEASLAGVVRTHKAARRLRVEADHRRRVPPRRPAAGGLAAAPAGAGPRRLRQPVGVDHARPPALAQGRVPPAAQRLRDARPASRQQRRRTGLPGALGRRARRQRRRWSLAGAALPGAWLVAVGRHCGADDAQRLADLLALARASGLPAVAAGVNGGQEPRKSDAAKKSGTKIAGREPGPAPQGCGLAAMNLLTNEPEKPRALHYAELHCCSNFSFLRGASHPEELVERRRIWATARWRSPTRPRWPGSCGRTRQPAAAA